MNCCFTGHRNVLITDDLMKRLENELIKLIQDGFTDFYAGGAAGWDMLCGKMVIKLREIYPVRLNIILPCRFEQHTLKWDQQQKDELEKLISLSDNVEIISEFYTDSCIKLRNHRLVSASSCCVCYYNKNRFRSGTGQTIRMAENKGIPVINLHL